MNFTTRIDLDRRQRRHRSLVRDEEHATVRESLTVDGKFPGHLSFANAHLLDVDLDHRAIELASDQQVASICGEVEMIRTVAGHRQAF